MTNRAKERRKQRLWERGLNHQFEWMRTLFLRWSKGKKLKEMKKNLDEFFENVKDEFTPEALELGRKQVEETIDEQIKKTIDIKFIKGNAKKTKSTKSDLPRVREEV